VSEEKNVETHIRAYALFSHHYAAVFEVFCDDIVEHQEPPILGRRRPNCVPGWGVLESRPWSGQKGRLL
jgi:hypothetical protein